MGELVNTLTLERNKFNLPILSIQQIRAGIAQIQEIRRLERRKDRGWGRREKHYGLITFINSSAGQNLHEILSHKTSKLSSWSLQRLLAEIYFIPGLILWYWETYWTPCKQRAFCLTKSWSWLAENPSQNQ